MFNKTFNKQAIIIMLDKVIGQAKILFNRFAIQEKPEVIPDGMLGISINSGVIVLVHVIINSLQDVTVRSFEVFPIETQTSIQNIIAKYIKDQNLQNIECCYVLSASQYVLSLIESVDNDSKAKEKAILWGVKDYINYSIDDAILDSFDIPIVRAKDNVKLAYAVAMRAKASEEIGDLINAALGHLKYVDIQELCLRNIMALYIDEIKGYLLLRLSEENINILLIKNNALFISRNTKLDLQKLNDFNPNINIADETFNVAENLVLELQRSLDYGNSLFKELRFSYINILPCNVNLDLFIPWAAEQLGLPINKIDLTEKIKFNKSITIQAQADCLLAIGAGLKHVGKFCNVSKH